MIKIFKKATAGLVLVLAIVCCLNIPTAKAQPGATVTMQTFYDELEPYGQWIDDPELGYVWAPDVDRDFKPYATNGHWVETEYGNTWVSDYDWGWAAFHYGRWRFANDYGWGMGSRNRMGTGLGKLAYRRRLLWLGTAWPRHQY